MVRKTLAILPVITAAAAAIRVVCDVVQRAQDKILERGVRRVEVNGADAVFVAEVGIGDLLEQVLAQNRDFPRRREKLAWGQLAISFLELHELSFDRPVQLGHVDRLDGCVRQIHTLEKDVPGSVIVTPSNL